MGRLSEAERIVQRRPAGGDLDDLDDLLELDTEELPVDLGPPRPAALTRLSLPVLSRPKSRDECASVPRPCPFVGCRYNLYLDVRADGAMRLNFPDRDPWDMATSCALDMASDGPRTLDTIAAMMGISKERARQIEASALIRVQVKFTPEDIY